jgi:tetratricopeptide (TPR) repeat protein
MGAEFPQDPPSLYARAVALYRAGRYQEALDLADAPQECGDPALPKVMAACARCLDRLDEAETWLRRAVELQPDATDPRYLLGVLLHQRGELGEAEACYRQALALAPDYADAHNNLGVLLRSLNRLDAAEASYRRALASKPADVDAHYNLGNLLMYGLKRYAEAEACYRRTLALSPGHADAHYNLGVLLKQLGRYGDAEACYRRALECRPDYVEVLNDLGVLLKQLKRYAEAEACYRRALAFKPGMVGALANLGNLCYGLQRFAEAEAYGRQALALEPGYAAAHANLGTLLCYGFKRYQEAEECYRRALALNPDDADARFDLGAMLLLLGRFEQGWRYCEARYHPGKTREQIAPPHYPFPRWQGEPLAGKSLLILPEQGFGDEIQFCRYAAVLKELGAEKVSLVCKAPLKPLFDRLEGADRVYTAEEAAAIPPHDYWTLALSIPLHCRTGPANIPAGLPYLRAVPEQVEYWASRLPVARKRVGLVWKGSATHSNDAHRSLPGLETLAPLWRVPGLSFVSLQKGEGEDQAAAPPPGQPLVHLGAELRDFADTAAVLTALDLLICVDTSAAHLAGALNRPCWVLLPSFVVDWRWQLERADSPWYPGALRLFRQPAEGGWAALVEAVALELQRWAGAG